MKIFAMIISALFFAGAANAEQGKDKNTQQIIKNGGGEVVTLGSSPSKVPNKAKEKNSRVIVLDNQPKKENKKNDEESGRVVTLK